MRILIYGNRFHGLNQGAPGLAGRPRQVRRRKLEAGVGEVGARALPGSVRIACEKFHKPLYCPSTEPA